MTSWQDRAWKLADRRPAAVLDPMWVLVRAGLLGGSVDGPHIAADASTGICPVCSGPTAVGWDIEERATPCTACRARVIAAAVAQDGGQ